MKLTPRRLVAAAAVVGAVATAGCSGFNDDRGIGDAPADQQDDRPVKVWPSPDKFHNIAAFCIGGNGVYVHTRAAAPVVVAADPECQPGGELTGAEENEG